MLYTIKANAALESYGFCNAMRQYAGNWQPRTIYDPTRRCYVEVQVADLGHKAPNLVAMPDEEILSDEVYKGTDELRLEAIRDYLATHGPDTVGGIRVGTGISESMVRKCLEENPGSFRVTGVAKVKKAKARTWGLL